MSGMSNPPATSSAPPSAGRADDLFALVKFVMSEESHAHLKNLQQAEVAAKAAMEDAASSRWKLDQAWSDYNKKFEKLDKDAAAFAEASAMQRDLHQSRQAAVQARESEVSRREEKCGERERALEDKANGLSKYYISRQEEFAHREREISGKANELSNREAVLERRHQALEQAMRS